MRLRDTIGVLQYPGAMRLSPSHDEGVSPENQREMQGKANYKSCDLWRRKPATPATAQQGASQGRAVLVSAPADDPVAEPNWTLEDDGDL